MRAVFGMRSPYGSPCTYSYLRFIFIHILYKYLFHIIHGSCVLCQNKKKTNKKIHRTRIIFGKNMPNGNTETSLSPSTDVNALCVPTRAQM